MGAHWTLFSLIMLISAAVFASEARAQEPRTPATRYTAVEARVDEAERALTNASAPEEVSAARLELQEARVMLQELRRSFENSKMQLETDLGMLGDPPDNGAEPPSVTELRQSYAERLSEFDRLSLLTSALQQRIARLQDDSAARLRDAFVSRVFERSPPPYLPAEVSGAVSEFGRVASGAVGWAAGLLRSGDAGQGGMPLIFVGLSVLLFYVLNIPVRDRIANQMWRRLPKRQLTPAGAPAIALTRASTRIALGALSVFIVHRTVLETGLAPENARGLVDQIARAVFWLLAANAVSRGVFAPGRPEWRVPNLSERTAASAHWGAVSVATLFAVDQIIAAAWGGDQMGPFLRLETLAAALIFGAVLIGVYRRLSHPHANPQDEASEVAETAPQPAERPVARGNALGRLFLVAPALVMVVASLLGYAALSRWVFEKAAYFALFAGYLYLLRAFLGAWTLLAVERLTFGRSRNETPPDDIVGFWTRLSVDILLLLAAAPVALAILGLEWTEIRTLALNVMSGFSIGSISVSPVSLVQGLLLVILILVLTRLLQRVLDNRILPMTRLNPGVRHSFKTLVGYVGLVFAFLTGVSALGFDLSNLAIIAGALSVGIGFGLQSIVNNFVSGLILLFERPIKIGDWVITASGEGTVKRINVRSTEIETFDRCSIIVPNSELISASVQNWTYKDETARVIVPVGVSYDTDPIYAREVLLKCADGEPEILSYPKAYVYFADFADSSLNLELRVFIRNANKALTVRNELRFKIYSALKEAGVEIPFPQRDLHVRSGLAGALRPIDAAADSD
ncbi:MAG: mechanosensitive ion channel domain-containing protein [Pseudomonadota bacterium]